jgi:hypothetical protein
MLLGQIDRLKISLAVGVLCCSTLPFAVQAASDHWNQMTWASSRLDETAGFWGGTATRSQTDWKVAEIYVATMGYAPDNDGLHYWVKQLEAGIGWTPTTVAQSFFDQPLVQEHYPSSQGHGPLIEALYQNIFGRAPDTKGYVYWLAELESQRVARNQMVIALLEGGWANPEAAADMARFGNRVTVALAFAAEQASRGLNYNQLTESEQDRLRQIGRELIAEISADPATRETAISRIGNLLNTL